MFPSHHDVAVLGAGPVGLLAAVRSAQLGRRVLLVAPRLPRRDDPPRVEAISAATLALLGEFGLGPGSLGVGMIHGERWAAWEGSDPVKRPAAPSAHVERSLLDAALADLVRTFPNILVLPGRATAAAPLSAAGLGVCRLLDATGRVAATARRRIGPARPWAGRLFWTPRQAHRIPDAFAIAATPDGYAYRLGSAYGTTVGFVGRRTAVSGSPHSMQRHHLAHAGWMFEGLPPLAEMVEVPGGGASVQWSEGGNDTLLVGGAALARDALSSQGLGTGLSEALAAAAISDAGEEALLASRQNEQRRSHLRSLLRICGSHRFADAPAWTDYRAFLERQEREPSPLTAALRDGRLVRLRSTSSSHADDRFSIPYVSDIAPSSGLSRDGSVAEGDAGTLSTGRAFVHPVDDGQQIGQGRLADADVGRGGAEGGKHTVDRLVDAMPVFGRTGL